VDRWGQQLDARARDPGRQGAGSIPARPRSVNATTTGATASSSICRSVSSARKPSS